MDRGEVVEVGPHDDLIARQGHYWRLYEAQARQAAAEDAERDASLLAHRVPVQSAHSASNQP